MQAFRRYPQQWRKRNELRLIGLRRRCDDFKRRLHRRTTARKRPAIKRISVLDNRGKRDSIANVVRSPSAYKSSMSLSFNIDDDILARLLRKRVFHTGDNYLSGARKAGVVVGIVEKHLAIARHWVTSDFVDYDPRSGGDRIPHAGDVERHLNLALARIARHPFAHGIDGKLVWALYDMHRLISNRYRSLSRLSRAYVGCNDILDGAVALSGLPLVDHDPSSVGRHGLPFDIGRCRHMNDVFDGLVLRFSVRAKRLRNAVKRDATPALRNGELVAGDCDRAAARRNGCVGLRRQFQRRRSCNWDIGDCYPRVRI